MSPLIGCPGPGGFLSGGAFVRGVFCPGDFCPRGLCPFPPSSMRICTVYAYHRSVTDKQTKKQKDKLGPVAPRGVDPRSPNFQGM